MENNLLKGTPWKSVLRFALPIIGASILQQLYNTVDTLVVGNFDSQSALSAVGSCAYLTAFYLSIAMGFANAAGVLVSQRFGAGDQAGMKRYAGTGVILLIGMGILVTAFAFGTNFLWLRYVIRVPGELFQAASLYISIYSCGFLFQCGYNIIACVLRAVGDSRSSLYFLLVTSILNIALDLLFVAGLHWGVMGVAVATIISQFVSMAVSFLYMLKKHPEFRPQRETWRFNRQLAAEILRLGAPMTIQQMVISCGFMLLQNIVNGFGAVMTASYTVACRLEIYMLVPGGDISQAMSVYAGQNFGAGRIDRIRAGIRQTVLMTFLCAVIIAALVFCFTGSLIGLFALEPAAAALCTRHLRTVCIGLLIYSLYQPMSGMFQGVGKPKLSMIISMLELGSRLLWALLLRGVLAEAAVWWNEPPSFLAAGIFAVLCYFFYKWWKPKGETVRKNER